MPIPFGHNSSQLEGLEQTHVEKKGQGRYLSEGPSDFPEKKVVTSRHPLPLTPWTYEREWDREDKKIQQANYRDLVYILWQKTRTQHNSLRNSLSLSQWNKRSNFLTHNLWLAYLVTYKKSWYALTFLRISEMVYINILLNIQRQIARSVLSMDLLTYNCIVCLHWWLLSKKDLC